MFRLGAVVLLAVGILAAALTRVVLAPASLAGRAAGSVLPTTVSGRYVVGANAMVRVGGTVYVGGDFSMVANRTGSAIVVPEAGGAPEPVAAEVAGGSVEAAVADGNGGWYIGGSFTSVGGVLRAGLAHLRPDGSLDSAFAPADLGQIHALVLVGGVLDVGGVHRVGSGPTSGVAPVLVALDAATGAARPTTYELLPVTSDNPTGVLALVASGGRLYVGFGPDGVAAYHAAGGAPIWKRTFTPVVAEAEGAGALVLDSARLLVGGKFQDAGNKNIEALDVTDGTPTGPQLSVPATTVTAIAVVGGSAYLARPGAAGVALVDLVTGAWRIWGAIYPTTLAADGTTLYVAGRTATDLRYTQHVYATQTGTAQPALRPVSPPLSGGAITLAPQGGHLFIGGAFIGAGGAARSNLAAFNIRTGALLTWHPSTDQMVSALAVAGHTIYLAGQFTHVSGVPRNGLAAVAADGTGHLLPWHPSAPGVDALAVSHGRVFAGGSIFLRPKQPKPGTPWRQEHLAAFSAGGAGSLLWYSPEATWNVSALAVWHDTLLAAGPSVIALPIGGNGRHDLWHQSTNDSIFVLATRGTILYAGGRFSRIGGQPRNNLAAFALDRGGALLAFAPALPPTVEALAPVGADVVYSSTAHALGAVSENGKVEPWHIDGHGWVNAILPVPGGLVVAGVFSWLGPAGHQAAGGIAWLP